MKDQIAHDKAAKLAKDKAEAESAQAKAAEAAASRPVSKEYTTSKLQVSSMLCVGGWVCMCRCAVGVCMCVVCGCVHVLGVSKFVYVFSVGCGSLLSSNKSFCRHVHQFRLFDGKTLTHTFEALNTLEDVKSYIATNRTDSGAPYSLMTNFPKKVFTATDSRRTLKDLGKWGSWLSLCDDASLCVVQVWCHLLC